MSKKVRHLVLHPFSAELRPNTSKNNMFYCLIDLFMPLRFFSLCIDQGPIHSLCGRSGRGKSFEFIAQTAWVVVA